MTKRPGRPVRGSSTGRPIMVLLDALGQRWTLRVLWELSSGPATFRDLRTKCEEVSPTVLNKRLKELKELNLIDLTVAGYALSKEGRSLAKLLGPLDHWASRWAKGL